MKTKFFLFTFMLFSSLTTYSQDFLDGSFSFSTNKESYITLKDGRELVGFISDIDRKKGLIEEITIKDKDKNKTKLKPEEIKHMYIAQNSLENFGKKNNVLNDVTRWSEDKSAHAEHIKNGYDYFESTEVMIKKEKLTLLMQLVNPGFARGIKVYFDPRASESASLGYGGLTLAGGGAKSYYFKKGDAVAFKMEKKNYDDEFENLYGDCPDFKKEFAKEQGWSKVEKHVFFYSEKCN
ncbi:MAG TPA: hypothetical protein VK169_06295 [Saprospiraceae bacterium]|nr:hypothetical protein [Saprospiraceae bacterium]